MSVSIVSNTTQLPNSTDPSTRNTGTTNLGVTDFLKLLSQQMQAQDPLSPTDNTQMIAQMASFTSLQQMSDLSTTMKSYTAQQGDMNAQNYLGKNVTLLDPTQGSVSGTVTGVDISGTAPKVVINGTSYDISSITAIQQAAAATAAATPATGS
jgi:flagellar basal-body rod modification protein FlgD